MLIAGVNYIHQDKVYDMNIAYILHLQYVHTDTVDSAVHPALAVWYTPTRSAQSNSAVGRTDALPLAQSNSRNRTDTLL